MNLHTGGFHFKSQFEFDRLKRKPTNVTLSCKSLFNLISHCYRISVEDPVSDFHRLNITNSYSNECCSSLKVFELYGCIDKSAKFSLPYGKYM